MRIYDLFERDPSRRLSPVVIVDNHEEDIVKTEIEEYVVTDQIRDSLNEIVERFIETRLGAYKGVCAWISGFFGSGKSHFLKMLGYILTNRNVYFDGRKIEVARYFEEKHGLRGGAILAKELKTRALFLNMLVYDRSKDQDLCRFIYKALLRELGLSDVFWVAEIELMLKKRGLWDQFLAFVKREEKMPWEDVRSIESRVRSILVRGLMEVDPKAYLDLNLTERALLDAEKEFTMNPQRLALRLLEEAEAIDKEKGRLVLLLDEVGLYIGGDTERLTELNALAEQIEKIGKGKVWILATAQEALEEIIPKVEAKRAQLEWIKDRFQIKINLLPENISTVVNKRLLEKNRDSSAFEELSQLYRKFEGSLKMGALLKEPARDPYQLFTHLTFENFLQTYPLMPYHVHLMVDIFGSLRSRGRVSPELTGRERAVLGVARSAILTLTNEKIGKLVTFDVIYDAIEEELKAVRSEYQSLIHSEIGKLGEIDGLKISAVAKALFLLQQVGEWVPCTVSNIAAVLYSETGVDQNRHEEKIQKCLQELEAKKFVIAEEGKYRFLSTVERTFEQDVASQFVGGGEKEELAVEIAEECLKDFKKYNYRKLRVFDVHLWIDDEEITTSGYLKLKFYTPYWLREKEDPIAKLYTKSLAEPDVIFWMCEESDTFSDKLERILAVKKALIERERRSPSPQEIKELERYRKAIDFIKNDELPNILNSSARKGTILYKGEEYKLSGKEEIKDIFSKFMKELTEEVYTEFHHAAVKIDKDTDITAVLSWTGGTLPPIYAELKLLDDNRNILVSAPTADRILRELKRKSDRGEECTGLSLSEHFGAPPYGWEPRVVRLILATLFKNGSIQVESEGRTYLSPNETGSHNVFESIRAFNKAKFYIGITITREQKEEASRKLSEIFGVAGGITVEQISESLTASLKEAIATLNELKMKEGFLSLPYSGAIRGLEEALKKIEAKPSHSLKVLAFLDNLNVIAEGIPLLTKLKEFHDTQKLSLYLTMQKFAGDPLANLLQVDKEKGVVERKEAFERRIKSSLLLEEWQKLYDDYLALNDRYNRRYLELHQARKEKVEIAIEGIKKWGETKGLDEKAIQNSLSPLIELLCKSDEKSYDEDRFRCINCNHTLSTIKNHLELIETRVEKVKEALMKQIPPVKKEFPAKEIKEAKVQSLEEFRKLVGDASEVAEYWLSQGKRVRVKFEVERLDG